MPMKTPKLYDERHFFKSQIQLMSAETPRCNIAVCVAHNLAPYNYYTFTMYTIKLYKKLEHIYSVHFYKCSSTIYLHLSF